MGIRINCFNILAKRVNFDMYLTATNVQNMTCCYFYLGEILNNTFSMKFWG
jgi:hypothetical protein